MPAAGSAQEDAVGEAGVLDLSPFCPRSLSATPLFLGARQWELCLPSPWLPCLPSAFLLVLASLCLSSGYSLEGLFFGKVEMGSAGCPSGACSGQLHNDEGMGFV